MDEQESELVRLKWQWDSVYSITCLDGVWSAYYLRTGEEFEADSLAELAAKMREDNARREQIRPGAAERMST